MPPIALNRRRFLGCSAAAGLALSQGRVGEASAEAATVRLGVIGLGTRGTSLLRSLLELPGTQVVALADAEPRHRARGQGIVEKARGARPDAYESAARVLERADVDAVAVALPCDLHAAAYRDAIRAGKHLYAEKPLALTVAACDMLIAETTRAPGVVVHVGFQRRSHPRYRDGVALVARGELGAPIAGHASWISSNGPMNGHDDWLARRARSGDWMVEQAAHVWDVYHWLKGGPPSRAFGQGSRDLFDSPPGRDVTDHYSVQLWWPDGFYVTFVQSWIAPADDRFTGITLQVLGTEGGSTSARARSRSATRRGRGRCSTPATRPTRGSRWRRSSARSATAATRPPAVPGRGPRRHPDRPARATRRRRPPGRLDRRGRRDGRGRGGCRSVDRSGLTRRRRIAIIPDASFGPAGADRRAQVDFRPGVHGGTQ